MRDRTIKRLIHLYDANRNVAPAAADKVEGKMLLWGCYVRDLIVLFASILWGGIGSGFFIYGLRQKAMIPLGVGIGLTAISYFIGSALYMSLAAVAIFVVMYWAKKQGY